MLDDRDFWVNTQKGGAEPQAEASGKVTDPSLDPGYRASKKPTTTDPPKKRSFDIESILADIRKKTEGTDQSQVSVSQTPHTAAPDDREIMWEILSTMRELTDEVKLLRSQLEAKPYDAAYYPSERPPCISQNIADLGDSASNAQTDNASEECFSGLALDGSGVPDSETKSNNRGEPQTEKLTEKPKKKKKSNKVLSVISNVLFYAVIVTMVLGAFLMRSTSKGSPFMFAGFSAANVLTGSMEDVYPKGSLIVTKSVDAKELNVGDDITFMVSETSSITHRIIGITENYQGTGERAFETKGTMNKNPDKEMVSAANVVGKVVFHSKALGDFANFVRANWPFLLFFIVIIVGLITFLKWNTKKSDSDEEKQDNKPKNEKPKSHTKKRTLKFNRKEK